MQATLAFPGTAPVPMPTGSLEAYIQTVNRFPILSAEVEQGLARLEGHPHAGTVYFGQDVVGKVADEIAQHHGSREAMSPATRTELQRFRAFTTHGSVVGAQDDFRRLAPLGWRDQIIGIAAS